MEPTDEMVEAASAAVGWEIDHLAMIKALSAALAVMPSEWNAAIEAAANMVRVQKHHSDFAFGHDNSEDRMADKLLKLRRPA
jgi:hypothetical protein